MTLFDQISEGIKQAMLARDAVRRDTLRNVKKEFIEAKTAGGAGGELSDAEALKIIARMVKKGRDAAAIFAEQGRQDLADEELAQVRVMEEFLPKALSTEDLVVAVRNIIAQTGAKGPKDMGKVMATASKVLAGQAEGRVISSVVKDLLSQMG